MSGKNNQKKEERKRRQELEKVLEFSNKELWRNLSKTKQNKVIGKYYNIIDSSNFDIKILLDDIRQTRITFAVLIMGMLLGIFASVFASIILKYIPDKKLYDIIMVVSFMAIFWSLIKAVGGLTKEDFREYKILDRLLKLVESDEIVKNNNISKNKIK